MTLQRLRRGYERALEWLVIALMVLLAVEVTAGVVFRYIGHALVWYDEVASILLAWLTFYGSALASVKRAHIGCPELIERLAPHARRAFAIVAQLLVIAFFALLLWVGISVLPVLATDRMVSLPAVPMSVVQSVIPISAALILVAEALHLATLLRAGPARASGAALSEGLH
jgi:TRAP-type C4-dicarboxylate transport system permease small subunit